MKKIFSIICCSSILLADSFNYYFFSIKENYKEYYLGSIIDRDYNSFGDLNGIGIKYTKNYYYSNIYIISEASYGKSIYNGAYQDGEKLITHQSNVQIYNLLIGINTNPYLLELGYRFWNRGESNNPGDYDEQYYWPYIGVGIQNLLVFNNSFFVQYTLKYNYAFSPKLKVLLGNNPTIDLGTTTGAQAQISFSKKFNYKYKIGIFYRYVYWHINRSNEINLIYNGKTYKIFEPESETRNQYIGIYLQKSF